MPEGPFRSGKTETGERKLPFQVLCVGMCRTGTQCTLSYLSPILSKLHPVTSPRHLQYTSMSTGFRILIWLTTSSLNPTNRSILPPSSHRSCLPVFLSTQILPADPSVLQPSPTPLKCSASAQSTTCARCARTDIRPCGSQRWKPSLKAKGRSLGRRSGIRLWVDLG